MQETALSLSRPWSIRKSSCKKGAFTGAEDLPETIHRPHRAATEHSLARNERNLILKVLQKCNRNEYETARVPGISRTDLYSKLKRNKIQPQWM